MNIGLAALGCIFLFLFIVTLVGILLFWKEEKSRPDFFAFLLPAMWLFGFIGCLTSMFYCHHENDVEFLKCDKEMYSTGYVYYAYYHCNECDSDYKIKIRDKDYYIYLIENK